MFKKRYAKPGTAPATLAPLEGGQGAPTELRLAEYDLTTLRETRVESIANLPERLDDGKVRWIEMNGLRDVEALRALGEKYGLHPLSLEDVLHTGQRPKVEAYEQHIFVVAQMIYHDREKRLCAEQVSFFLCRNLLITVQEDPALDVFDPVRERLRGGRGFIRKLGADYLAYALLDAIVDHCFPVLEKIGESIEELEDDLLHAPTRSCVHRLHDHRRVLMQIRRFVWPERDVISALLHDERGLISSETKVFLRDCYDHCIQIMDLLESYRDATGSLLEMYLSSVSLRTNEIVRVLTVISAIFIPLTFLAGIWGMNFEFMPELKQPWGYAAALGLMFTVAAGQIAYFKRKGWM